MVSLVNYFKYLKKKKNVNPIQTFSDKAEEETLPNSLYEANITQITKPKISQLKKSTD